MQMHSILRRRFTALAALAVVALAGACKDSSGLDDHEPEVESMRITVTGGSVVTVSATGVVTGTLTIPTGTASTITVEFLNGAGQPDDHVDGDEFEVSVAPAAGVTFTRTGPFTGTLTGGAAGTVAVQFGLLHIEENHNDFGPFTVNVQLVSPVVVAGN